MSSANRVDFHEYRRRGNAESERPCKDTGRSRFIEAFFPGWKSAALSPRNQGGNRLFSMLQSDLAIRPLECVQPDRAQRIAQHRRHPAGVERQRDRWRKIRPGFAGAPEIHTVLRTEICAGLRASCNMR